MLALFQGIGMPITKRSKRVAFQIGGALAAAVLIQGTAVGGDFSSTDLDHQMKASVGLVVTEQYNDNIFATRAVKVPDGITVVSPSVDLEMRGKYSRLNVGAVAELTTYAAYSSEDTQDFDLYANGRYRFNPNLLMVAGLAYDRKHDDRSSPDDALGVIPTVYYVTRAYSALQAKNGAATFKIGYTYDHYNFEDVERADGGTVNNDDRDRDVGTAGIRIGYNVTKRDELFASLGYDIRNYRYSPDDNGFYRDSDGLRATAGARSKISDDLDIEAYAGWIYQSYDDARFGDVSAPDFGGLLVWTPVAGLTIEAKAERSIQETTLYGSSGYLQTNARLSFVSWLRPDLRLNGGVAYYDNEYKDIARRDGIAEAWLGLRRYVSPHVYLGANYTFTSRDSTDILESYDQSVIMFRIGRTQDPAYTGDELAAPKIAKVQRNGAYVGLKAGLIGTEAKLEGPRGGAEDDDGQGPGTLMADFGDHDGFAAGGFVGYGLAVGYWQLALEADLTGSTADWTHSRLPGGRVFSVDRGMGYGLSAIFGRYLNGGSAVYVRAGVVYQDFDTAYQTPNNTFARSDTKLGLRLGVGGSVPLGDRLALRMEYEYTTFGDERIGPPRGPDTFAYDESGTWLSLVYAFHAMDPANVPSFTVDWRGFYWGGQIGHGTLSSLARGDRDEHDPPSVLLADFSDTGVTGGLFAGYGLSFDRFYLAAELEAEISDANWDHERAPTGRSFAVDKKGSIGAGIRLGYLVNQAAMLYGRVGVVQSYFDMDLDRGSHAVSQDDSITALRYGFGMELPATRHVALRLDYTFTDYGTLQLAAPPAGDVEAYRTSESLFRLGTVVRY
ncbi:MAG: outer membrane beta-barrel protein [Hyphomicrobiaceae bacterium]